MVLAYNNSDVANLSFLHKQLVDVFLGKLLIGIDSGSSKSKPVRIVHRSDGSGTTAVFAHKPF